MARQQRVKQRFVRTKIKHRLKLNSRYDPKQWFRCSFVETISPGMANFLNAWVKQLLEVCDGK